MPDIFLRPLSLDANAADVRLWDTTLASVITATMAAEEDGSDTASGVLSVVASVSMAAQEVGQDTASGAASVIVAAAMSAQETGSDTFAGTLTVTDAIITMFMAAQETGSDTAGFIVTLGPIEIQPVYVPSAALGNVIVYPGMIVNAPSPPSTTIEPEPEPWPTMLAA